LPDGLRDLNTINWIAVTDQLPPVNELGSSQEVLIVVAGFATDEAHFPYEVSRISLGAYHTPAQRWTTYLHHIGFPVVTHWAEKPDLPPVQLKLL